MNMQVSYAKNPIQNKARPHKITSSPCTIFFSSGMADHALRLGPYMRRSSLKYHLHRHLWSRRMANQKHKQNTNTNHKGRNANPPARYVLRHPAEKQSKKRTGQGPTKTTTPKICHGHSGEKPLCRNSQKDAQTNWLLPRKVKHAS